MLETLLGPTARGLLIVPGKALPRQPDPRSAVSCLSSGKALHHALYLPAPILLLAGKQLWLHHSGPSPLKTTQGYLRLLDCAHPAITPPGRPLPLHRSGSRYRMFCPSSTWLVSRRRSDLANIAASVRHPDNLPRARNHSQPPSDPSPMEFGVSHPPYTPQATLLARLP